MHCLAWKRGPGEVEGGVFGGDLTELGFGIIRYDGYAMEATHAGF